MVSINVPPHELINHVLPHERKQVLDTYLIGAPNTTRRIGFPAWMEGKPHHRVIKAESQTQYQETISTMVSLLKEEVKVKHTVVERELMKFDDWSDLSQASNPYFRYESCKSIAHDIASVRQLAKLLPVRKNPNLISARAQAREIERPVARLTFSSVEEARRRALVLMSKTWDAVTHTFAQLVSWEALFCIYIDQNEVCFIFCRL
jgi:hypothetical protein